MFQAFRLTNEPGGQGLSCTAEGLSLAGVPLLRKTEAGFEPRPKTETAALFKAAYGDEFDPSRLNSSLVVIARALNDGDLARAMMSTVLTRTPELSTEEILRLRNAEDDLAKYDFNPNEPRNYHGRWTTDGGAGASSPATAQRGKASGRESKPTSARLSHPEENASEGAAQLISAAFTTAAKARKITTSRSPSPLSKGSSENTTTSVQSSFRSRLLSLANGSRARADSCRRTPGSARSQNMPFFRIVSRSGSLTITSLQLPTSICSPLQSFSTKERLTAALPALGNCRDRCSMWLS